MNKILENVLEEEREGFIVSDLSSANWVLKKLKAIEEKEEEIKAVAAEELKAIAEEVNKIQSWLDNELKAYEGDKEYLEGLLIAYYKQQKELDPKFKLSTPYGKVNSRKVTKWEYCDEDGLIDYLKENNTDCIRIKEEIDKAYLKKVYKNGVNQETGEVLPFIRIKKEENINIKVD